MSPQRALPCIAFGVLFAAAALAQDYPARPVRLIVPIGPGGGTDILGRHVAQKLGERLKQSVIVENRPGAGSLVGTEYAAKAAPDGYTLLVGGIFNMVMNPALMKSLPYDPLRDFVPLGYVSAYPFVLVARSDLPASSLAQLVDYARAKPGRLTYGSAGIGTLQHVWGAILFKSLGLDLVPVAFKSPPAPPPGEPLGREGARAGGEAQSPRGHRRPTLARARVRTDSDGNRPRAIRRRKLVRAVRARGGASESGGDAARGARRGAAGPRVRRAHRARRRPRPRHRSRRAAQVPGGRGRALDRARRALRREHRLGGARARCAGPPGWSSSRPSCSGRATGSWRARCATPSRRASPRSAGFSSCSRSCCRSPSPT